MTADDVVRALDLQPHQEGGFDREPGRDHPAGGGRAASAAFYCLLRGGRALTPLSRRYTASR